MLGMVLAAGAGRRLRPYTDTLPKALVPVDDETTILDLTLSNFSKVGLKDVAVIVGYKSQAVEDRKKDLESRHGVNLELIFNDKAEEWNNAYSLWCARDLFSQGFLLANGDTVHPVGVQETLLANRGPAILLAVDTVKKLAEEEMKLTIDCAGNLAKITKLMDPQSAFGEYIGLTLVEPESAEKLTASLETTWKLNPDLYYEDGYQEYVDRGGVINLQPIGEVSWVEVDNHDDLAKARSIACHY
ncbi:MAG: phosphocholine cytidylyltransferase family protein [Actinobacteria bacterium]|nr:phosphocholine cytidylyltransferase family protein [Actinomycetota bacterium]